MALPLAMALAETWGIAEELARNWLAIKPAIKEAVDSQLPGRENVPADAYRHLLWGAELTRKFGPDVARRILETHEIQGDLSTRVGIGSQSPAAAAMDRHNNVLAVEIGRTARTWSEVEQGAREVIDGSRGDGSDGGAVWLPEAQWSSHPKDPTTGEERPPADWNWPEIDWNKSIESDPDYRYPFDDESWRFTPAIDDPGAMLDSTRPVAELNPLSRPAASWSEQDLHRVMASPAYLQPSHPGRARAHAMVREWFARAEETGPARVDATGRRVPERAMAAAPAGGACEVPVQAHSRQGGKIEVDAHCRARPAA